MTHPEEMPSVSYVVFCPEYGYGWTRLCGPFFSVVYFETDMGVEEVVLLTEDIEVIYEYEEE